MLSLHKEHYDAPYHLPIQDRHRWWHPVIGYGVEYTDDHGEPVPAGDQLLDELRGKLVRYAVLPSEEAYDAVTCYIAASHAVTAWEHATRLAIVSPEKRCGKSRLLDVIEATCHKPLITVNISPAALVRSLDTTPPTLLLDEADTIFGKKSADNHDDLRGIINAGHQRNRPYIRWDVATRKPEHCPTFAMAVLAGIGDLPDTIMDRAVIVRMRRRAPDERVHPFRRRRDLPELRNVGSRVAYWVESELDSLLGAEPEMPVEDRAADTWEPLVAIADAAGGAWPKRIRTACTVMVAEAEEDAGSTYARTLLADLRKVFSFVQGNLHSTTILARLHRLIEGPWKNYYGRELTSRDLSELLGKYGIKSITVKESGSDKPGRGYRRDDLYEAWQRYLPPPSGEDFTDDFDDGGLPGAW